jgi:hypothetical protein
MNHLKTPANPVQRISVQYYDEEEYDGLGFLDYPKRRGLDPRSLFSHSSKALGERVTCKGAIAYFKKIVGRMLPATEESYGQRVFEKLRFLETTYELMRDDADRLLQTESPSLQAMVQELSHDSLNAAQKTRFTTKFNSWFSFCRAGKPVEQFTIADIHAYYIDNLISTYDTVADPEVNSCRANFDLIQEKIKLIYKIAMLVPDATHHQLPSYEDGLRIGSKVSWWTRSLVLPWYHSDADKLRMLLFCWVGNYDLFPGDFDYDGGDPEASINWTTDFESFHIKQLRDRNFVRDTRERFLQVAKVLSRRYWNL